MRIKSTRQPRKMKKVLALILLVALLLALGYGVFAYTADWFPFKETSFQTDDQGRGINQNKTEQEKQQTENLEDDPGSKTDTPNTDTPGQPGIDTITNFRTVDVMMTSTSQSVDKGTVEASGFVVNAVENDGVCTYVFSSQSGSTIVKKEMGVLVNPSSTACKTVRFPSSELTPGVWNVSILYVSSKSKGASSPMNLTVE